MPKNRSATLLPSLVFLLICGISVPHVDGQTYTANFSAINTTAAEEDVPLFPDDVEEEREEPSRLITFFTPTSSLQPHAFLTWVPPAPLLVIPVPPVPYWPVRSPLSGDPEERLPPEPEPLVGDIHFEVEGDATFRVLPGDAGINYRISADQIRGVIAIELQLVPLADEDEEDLIVADLLSRTNIGSGTIRGIVARGTLRSRDLLGPLAGQDMEELIREIEFGNVYLVIYTDDYRYLGLRGRLY